MNTLPFISTLRKSALESGTNRDIFLGSEEAKTGDKSIAVEQKLFAAWLDGQSLREIGRRYGMSRMSVSRLARKYRWMERRNRLEQIADNCLASDYRQLAIRLYQTHSLLAEIHEKAVKQVQHYFQSLLNTGNDREIIKFCRGRAVKCLLGDHGELVAAFLKLFGRTERTMRQELQLRRPHQNLDPKREPNDHNNDQSSVPKYLGFTPEQFNEFARFVVERQQAHSGQSDSLPNGDYEHTETKIENECGESRSVAFV